MPRQEHYVYVRDGRIILADPDEVCAFRTTGEHYAPAAPQRAIQAEQSTDADLCATLQVTQSAALRDGQDAAQSGRPSTIQLGAPNVAHLENPTIALRGGPNLAFAGSQSLAPNGDQSAAVQSIQSVAPSHPTPNPSRPEFEPTQDAKTDSSGARLYSVGGGGSQHTSLATPLPHLQLRSLNTPLLQAGTPMLEQLPYFGDAKEQRQGKTLFFTYT